MTPIRILALVVVVAVVATVFLIHPDTRAAFRRFYWTDERILRKAIQKHRNVLRMNNAAFLRRDPQGNLVLADDLLKSPLGEYINDLVAKSTSFAEYKNLGTMDEHDENVNNHDDTVRARSLRIIVEFLELSQREYQVATAMFL